MVIIRSESTLATTSEEARRIIGWRLVRETRWVFLAELWSTFSGIAGSRMSDVFRERSLQIQFSVTILGNCPAYIGYWNGHITVPSQLRFPLEKMHALHFPLLEELRMPLATLWLDRAITVY